MIYGPRNFQNFRSNQNTTRHTLKMSGNEQEMVTTHTVNTKKKNLTNEQRQGVLHFLLERLNGEQLQLNAINDAAAKFDVSRLTISRIWKRARSSIDRGDVCIDVSSRKAGRSGRKRKDWSENLDKMKDIPLAQRGTLRSLSYAIEIPKTTLIALLREKALKRVSSTVKPLLTEENKKARLEFCLKHVESNGLFQEHA